MVIFSKNGTFVKRFSLFFIFFILFFIEGGVEGGGMDENYIRICQFIMEKSQTRLPFFRYYHKEKWNKNLDGYLQ